MREIRFPISVIYETQGITPIKDVILALEATEAISRDAIALLPSLYRGIRVEESYVSVQRLTQESPLREVFVIGLFLAYQDDLEDEIPAMLEDILNISIPDRYDTAVTAAFMMVLFYGLSLAKDAVSRSMLGNPISEVLDEVTSDISGLTNVPERQIRKILESRISKPPLARRLASSAVNFFLPSRREGSSPVVIDKRRIEPPVISQIPFPEQIEGKEDFEKYDVYDGVEIILHAQDRDKNATGWAAVVSDVSEKRLRLKLIDPIRPRDLWGKDRVTGDVVVVSKLSGDGFSPSEVHLMRVDD